jgi:16S rRNA A1518/A1519 N6-dimethyltransferase RsmA/KsgA/DIM1 with predicted DNA glycosylase/AP lyase activity
MKRTGNAFSAGGEPRPSRTSAEAAEEVLDRAGISGERRAETLSKEEFATLAATVEDIVVSGT